MSLGVAAPTPTPPFITLYAEKRLDFPGAGNRALLANKLAAVLTMAAESHRAMHVALHVEINAVLGHAVLEQMVHGDLHHALGAAQHDQRAGKIDLHPVKHLRATTDVPRPKRHPDIGRDQNLRVT